METQNKLLIFDSKVTNNNYKNISLPLRSHNIIKMSFI